MRPPNKYGVGATTDGKIFITKPPVRGVALTKDEAKQLAGYLAVVSGASPATMQEMMEHIVEPSREKS